tara:strand:+ start:1610 stop:1810 length:201 start_codon:yes stop_codon:yes gene_type:complete
MSQHKPIMKVEETLRDINRKLDQMIIDMQYIKSDTKLIKEDIEKKERIKQEQEKYVEVPTSRGWFF